MVWHFRLLVVILKLFATFYLDHEAINACFLIFVFSKALWLHRRFLSLFWMKHLTSNNQNINCRSLCKSSENDDIFTFINAELKLLSHCTIIPDNVFEDYEAQTIHSATYFMWLAKQMPLPFGIELRNSSLYGPLETLLKKTGKSFLLDSLAENCVSIKALNWRTCCMTMVIGVSPLYNYLRWHCFKDMDLSVQRNSHASLWWILLEMVQLIGNFQF